MALKPERGPWPEPTNGSLVHTSVSMSATVLLATANCQECNTMHAVGTRDTGLYRPQM